MASQYYDAERNQFFLDLHGVLKRDAARVIQKRIEECGRYGIGHLEVVYGTPDFFDGSIASAVRQVVSESPHVLAGLMPREFLDNCENYSARVAKVTVPLRISGANAARDERMVFLPFPASREPDPWLRRLCENPFVPLQQNFSRQEGAKFIGRGCRAESLDSDTLSRDELEAFCRNWQPPPKQEVPDTVVEAPAPIPIPIPTVEENWTAAWSDAAESFAAGDLKGAHAFLERCMDLSAASPNGRLLARTLGALSILSGAQHQAGESRAYLDSARAAFDDVPTDTTGERVEVESRVVETMVAEGRIADAVSLLRDLREQLQSKADDYPLESIYLLSSEAALRRQMDDHQMAADLLNRALAMAEAFADCPPMMTANMRMQLGFLELQRGVLRKALVHLTQAAEELEGNPETFAQSFLCRRGIATAADQLGYKASAERVLRHLISIPTRAGSMAESASLSALIELGNVCFGQRRLSEAEKIYREAQVKVIAAGSPPLFCFDIHQNLGNTYTHLGRFPEALNEFKVAASIATEIFPGSHPNVAQLHRNLAVCYAHSGRLQEARAANDEALRIYGSCGGLLLPEVAETHFSQAMFHCEDREWDEAEYHLRLALNMMNEIYGDCHPATAHVLLKLGRVLFELGSNLQARPMLVRAIQALEDHRQDPMLLWEAYTTLEMVQLAAGQRKEAKKSDQKASYYRHLAKRNKNPSAIDPSGKHRTM